MDEDKDVPSADHDSPWKEALEVYFEPFLALLFPSVHAQVDWAQPVEFLDKELQALDGDAEQGRQYVDKLVKVRALSGFDAWVVVHVEVQGSPDSSFARRMHRYYARLEDKFSIPVVSLAVLADDRPSFRPSKYENELWGCSVSFRFPVRKLLDWLDKWDELEASRNVFAPIVMAQIREKTERTLERRKFWKFKLLKRLYELGYNREDINQLYRLIDWMMRLPEPDEERIYQEIKTIREQKLMPYVTTAERVERELGLQEGLKQGLQKGHRQGEVDMLMRQVTLKFGEATAEEYNGVIASADEEQLRQWAEGILTADSAKTLFG
ncbi:hypothetical protein SAMN05216526_1544 [Ectothiorhodosinus mongolicus]|uniref:DUF4351 domain-containing protein n=1 Tax=Ectothiorhodosinus mongolicus TaxID=233100 RepID=A0A1R3W434_9GAMM|nr:hypothetical protein [Ectothiorhodosinus mongolicus]ULX57396.1 hypothetical protein CKX93_06735 [Ectothiorhodosinus mongolicus]SIT71382.1 hypothetical protein SAMN05216526_1544 [Ectothiorhodosinus mongolicus]